MDKGHQSSHRCQQRAGDSGDASLFDHTVSGEIMALDVNVGARNRAAGLPRNPCGSFMDALPRLRPSKKRQSKVSAHDELSSAVDEPEFTAINSTGVRVEYVAAGVLIAL